MALAFSTCATTLRKRPSLEGDKTAGVAPTLVADMRSLVSKLVVGLGGDPRRSSFETYRPADEKEEWLSPSLDFGRCFP